MSHLPIQSASTPIDTRQAETDEQLIGLWLHGRPKTTTEAYQTDVNRFRSFISKPLHQIRLAEIQDFADKLEEMGLRPTSQHRILSSVKSLFAYGHRLGYLPFDTSRPLKLPKVTDSLNERILSEGEVQKVIALEPNPRNQVMLLLLYATGVRVSELCGLRWNDLSSRDNGGQMTVHGKGNKTRTILLPTSVWQAAQSLCINEQNLDSPVLRSRRGGHLHRSQVVRIVRNAATRAGIEKAVSPHWLRHAHASHALDRGAGIHLVQATLGHSSVATTGRYLHARPSESSSQYLSI